MQAAGRRKQSAGFSSRAADREQLDVRRKISNVQTPVDASVVAAVQREGRHLVVAGQERGRAAQGLESHVGRDTKLLGDAQLDGSWDFLHALGTATRIAVAAERSLRGLGEAERVLAAEHGFYFGGEEVGSAGDRTTHLEGRRGRCGGGRTSAEGGRFLG